MEGEVGEIVTPSLIKGSRVRQKQLAVHKILKKGLERKA